MRRIQRTAHPVLWILVTLLTLVAAFILPGVF